MVDLNLATHRRSLAFLGDRHHGVCRRIPSISSPSHVSTTKGRHGRLVAPSRLLCPPQQQQKNRQGQEKQVNQGQFKEKAKKRQAKGTGGVTNSGVGDQGVKLVTSLIMHMLHATTMGIQGTIELCVRNPRGVLFAKLLLIKWILSC